MQYPWHSGYIGVTIRLSSDEDGVDHHRVSDVIAHWPGRFASTPRDEQYTGAAEAWGSSDSVTGVSCMRSLASTDELDAAERSPRELLQQQHE